MVVIGAPHTSNFDFILFLGALHYLNVSVRYLGKHQLFRWPFGWLFKRWGGIPVDRTRAGGVVGQTKAAFDEADEMILVIAPEGTRSAAKKWKSGFVKIAEAAQVPIVPAGVDGPNKVLTIGPAIEVGPDLMDNIKAFYANQPGLKPDRKGPVQLVEDPLPS